MFLQKVISFFLVVLSMIGLLFTPDKTLPEVYTKRDYPVVEPNGEKYVGIRSEVRDCGGVPTLYVQGEPFNSVAYMTYIEQNNAYKDFADAGYNFFSVPVLFAGRWINAGFDLKPFKKGIFDVKGEPDYSLMDEAVQNILAVCPDAYIIPRVNISLPRWWEQEHPDDVNILPDGTTLRESFYSEAWRADAKAMLRELVQYINTTDYASHIVGYQIAGGNTEEWFHFDLNAGYCKNAEEGFKVFLETYYPDTKFTGLPSLKKLSKQGNYTGDPYLSRFLEYASFAVADAICDFASVVKQETGGNVVVGTFYGYTLEVTNPLWGVHGLKYLLEDKNIDFICSPNSYLGTRNPDIDWTEMYPADSVRLHGKVCFQECDVRTHLTKLLGESAPEIDPDRKYSAPVWQPCKDKETAQNILRKTFARQLVKGNGLWWFDMWGGWFSDSEMMAEMDFYRRLNARNLQWEDRKPHNEVAVFVDESAYKYMTNRPLRNAISDGRQALGAMGANYDIYDVYDFPAVCENYKAVIFMPGAKTEYMKNALSLCKQNHIPYLSSTGLKKNFTEAELRAFLKASGVHLYCETGDIVYVGSHFLALYAVTEGTKTVKLDKSYTVKGLLGSDISLQSDKISLHLQKGETVLLELS